MSKAMRGYGCIMKRVKKNQGGLSQDKPDIKILANKKIKDVRTDEGKYTSKIKKFLGKTKDRKPPKKRLRPANLKLSVTTID